MQLPLYTLACTDNFNAGHTILVTIFQNTIMWTRQQSWTTWLICHFNLSNISINIPL